MPEKIKTLETVIKNRWGGAANIKGIQYQLLCSILKSFDILDIDSDASIRLEGIEDFDFLNEPKKNEYFQIKSLKKFDKLTWYKILYNFYEVFDLESSASFTLITDYLFENDKNYLALRDYYRLSSSEQDSFVNDIQVTLNKDSNSDKNKEIEKDKFNLLLERIKFSYLSLDEIEIKLKRKVLELFDLKTDKSDIYISYFIKMFLNWSKEGSTKDKRSELKKIKSFDLIKLQDEIESSIASEEEFRAKGKGLIDNLNWDKSEKIEDFYDGKGTRISHIVSACDIERPHWLNHIQLSLSNSDICIIKSSSGQGKSALLYRYALNYWEKEDIYQINLIEKPEDVELIKKYLAFRIKLSPNILLLLDNLNHETKYWYKLAKYCADYNIKMLITVREEDWFRYEHKSSVNREVVNLKLYLEEAKNLFLILKKKKKLHETVKNKGYEKYFEKISEPKLLLEYIYLLTHGQMLEDRLRDQIKNFDFYKNESSSKKKILLRNIALANCLRVSVNIEKLSRNLSIEDREDVLTILESLCGEYILKDDEQVLGLHWVRSEHLNRILHEGHINPAFTVIELLDYIDLNYISILISNALDDNSIDNKKLFDEIKDIIQKKSYPLKIVIQILSGFFEGGEKKFYKENNELFHKAFELAGTSGVFMLSSNHMPIINPKTIDSMLETLPNNENVLKLKEYSLQINEEERGKEYVEMLLKDIQGSLEISSNESDIRTIGVFLDWLSLCSITYTNWNIIKDKVLNIQINNNLAVEDLAIFTQGLFRYDKDSYHDFINKDNNLLFDYLKAKTKCFEIEIIDNELICEFLIDYDSDINFNDQAVNRLNILRSIFPYCDLYSTRPFHPIVTPSVDSSLKNIKPEWIPFKSDISKNVLFYQYVSEQYSTDSYYDFQLQWSKIRKSALKIVTDSIILFQKLINNQNLKNNQNNKYFDKNLAYLLEHSYNLPKQSSLSETSSLDNWKNPFTNFYKFLLNYLGIIKVYYENNIENLIVHNFIDCKKDLNQFHNFFGEVFLSSADYFKMKSFEEKEIEIYNKLANYLELWHENKFAEKPISNFDNYFEEQKANKYNAIIDRLKNIDCDFHILFPDNFFYDFPFIYIPIYFEVNDPIKDKENLYHLLSEIDDLSFEDNLYFCLIPIHRGKKFREEAYQLSPYQIKIILDGKNDKWELLTPRILDKKITELQNNKIGYKKIPLFYIKINTLEVFLKLSHITKISDIAGDYFYGDNSFLEESQQYYFEKIKKIELEILKTISELEKYIKHLQIVDIDEIISILQQVKLSCLKNKSAILVQSGDLEISKIEEFIGIDHSYNNVK